MQYNCSFLCAHSHVRLFYDPMDSSPPGSSVDGILQARILEWVAISFCRGSSWPRNQTGISLRLPCWQADSLPLCHLRNTKYNREEKESPLIHPEILRSKRNILRMKLQSSMRVERTKSFPHFNSAQRNSVPLAFLVPAFLHWENIPWVLLYVRHLLRMLGIWQWEG